MVGSVRFIWYQQEKKRVMHYSQCPRKQFAIVFGIDIITFRTKVKKITLIFCRIRITHKKGEKKKYFPSTLYSSEQNLDMRWILNKWVVLFLYGLQIGRLIANHFLTILVLTPPAITKTKTTYS